jgi:DNA-binding XRE family transcriptional regulator
MELCALVGLNVRRHRLAAGMTQEELAFRAGMDRTYLSDIERGRRNPTLLTMRTAEGTLTPPSCAKRLAYKTLRCANRCPPRIPFAYHVVPIGRQTRKVSYKSAAKAILPS